MLTGTWRRSTLGATMILLGVSISQQPAAAEILTGLTANSLVTFDSATPGTIITNAAISGVLAGDTLIGIDRRPSLGPNNGVLYGVGVNFATGTGRIYTLNSMSGLAVAGSVFSADPADTTAPFPFTSVTGTAFGIDFNPVPDRLRLVSNTGQNLRINVDNGLVQLDGALAYMMGDPNFGSAPMITSVAYSNNFGGATTTTLRGVDTSMNPDLLVVHTDPNGGVLMTSLGLPFNGPGMFSAYDISGLTGTPFFAVQIPGGPSQLYATGPGGVTLIGTIGGSPLIGLAAGVGAPIPEPGTVILSAIGLAAVLAGRLRKRK